MTTFELIGVNPFDYANDDIFGFTGITDEDGIKIGDYEMRRGEREFFGIKFTGVDKIDDQVDEDTQRILHGGVINFDIVYNIHGSNYDYKTVGHIAYEYTDNLFIMAMHQMIADVFSSCFHDFIIEKTNIKDYTDLSVLNFMLDSSNREYYTRFIQHITMYYLSVVQPRMTLEEVEYYAKLKRIVNILDEK